jgi:multimeric flavodoxin WrbA
MKVSVFNGSPRKGGNTDLLLTEAEKAVKTAASSAGPGSHEGHQWTRYDLNTMNIRSCQDCGGCEKTGECVIKDDMTLIYQAIREADRIILASPVFFFALSAQTKAVIDRCQAFWCEKYLLKRPLPEGPFGRKGLLVLVGGMKKDIGIECSAATARAFFRTVSVPEDETLGFLEVDEKGAIAKHATALADVYNAAGRLVTPVKR